MCTQEMHLVDRGMKFYKVCWPVEGEYLWKFKCLWKGTKEIKFYVCWTVEGNHGNLNACGRGPWNLNSMCAGLWKVTMAYCSPTSSTISGRIRPLGSSLPKAHEHQFRAVIRIRIRFIRIRVGTDSHVIEKLQ